MKIYKLYKLNSYVRVTLSFVDQFKRYSSTFDNSSSQQIHRFFPDIYEAYNKESELISECTNRIRKRFVIKLGWGESLSYGGVFGNFRISIYRERNDWWWIDVMNSSDGNISGQMQVPAEDSRWMQQQWRRGVGMGAISAMITSITASAQPISQILVA